MSPLPTSLLAFARRGLTVRRGALALVVACSSSLLFALVSATERTRSATARLALAAERLDAITEPQAGDDTRRAAVAWGYAERLRLGLESPFRLIEGAARDPRLAADERRTVAWALLAHLVSGATHAVHPAALDGIGRTAAARAISGEQHLRLIARAIGAGSDPRAGELGVRIAYTLAAAERLLDAGAVTHAAGAAAMLADREIARREALALLRAGGDPIAEVRRRRAQRAFYVERPALFVTGARVERTGVEIGRWVLDSLRAMTPEPPQPLSMPADTTAARLAPELRAAGAAMPPEAGIAVAVRRHLALLRAGRSQLDPGALASAHNAEMLAALLAAAAPEDASQPVARLQLAAAVAVRAGAQDPIRFPGDSPPSAAELAATLGIAEITFDRGVPIAWRPHFLGRFADGVADLRRVLPGMNLDSLRVRFRMNSPADSALAMHDPRTRTLHLPVFTAGGTLAHELAHDLDRQMAARQGHFGYRSDYVARSGRDRTRGNTSVVASLRALTDDAPSGRRRAVERPAEIFATQLDWFVARSLASVGMSSGFLTAVQDELFTGHVVHPERLRPGARASLVNALHGITTVAPFAAAEQPPGVPTLLRWTLASPVEREAVNAALAQQGRAWDPPRLHLKESECAVSMNVRAEIVRMAAESRARGWLRSRQGRAALSDTRADAPWAPGHAERSVNALRDRILLDLASAPLLTGGLGGYVAPLAAEARCG